MKLSGYGYQMSGKPKGYTNNNRMAWNVIIKVNQFNSPSGYFDNYSKRKQLTQKQNEKIGVKVELVRMRNGMWKFVILTPLKILCICPGNYPETW